MTMLNALFFQVDFLRTANNFNIVHIRNLHERFCQISHFIF